MIHHLLIVFGVQIGLIYYFMTRTVDGNWFKRGNADRSAIVRFVCLMKTWDKGRLMIATATVEKMQCQSCFASLNIKGQWSNIVVCDYCGTEHTLSESVKQVKAHDSQRFVVKLFRILARKFEDEELEQLIFELNYALPRQCSILHPDDIAGNVRSAKARNLVSWCRRRSYLQELVDTVVTLRPSLALDLATG